MHPATLVYLFFVSLASLSRAQNDTSINTSEQTEMPSSTIQSTNTSSFTSQSTDTSSSPSEDSSTTTSESTDSNNWSTITASPSLLTPTSTSADDSSFIQWLPNGGDTIWPEDNDDIAIIDPEVSSFSTNETTSIASLVAQGLWQSNGTWSKPPPVGADFPSQPNATATLSVITNGPVGPCDSVEVWWAGGVGPYTIYYMPLTVNQSIEDFDANTTEYYVSTEWSYGPIRIRQLGDPKQRGLTRIRIQDSTNQNTVTWFSNTKPPVFFPCSFPIGGSSPPSTPSQAMEMSTFKPPLITLSTNQPGAEPTTIFIATIDGTRSTVIPTFTSEDMPTNSAQPGASVANIAGNPAAPPQPTSVVASGSVLHGFSGNPNTNAPSGGTASSGNGSNGDSNPPVASGHGSTYSTSNGSTHQGSVGGGFSTSSPGNKPASSSESTVNAASSVDSVGSIHSGSSADSISIGSTSNSSTQTGGPQNTTGRQTTSNSLSSQHTSLQVAGQGVTNASDTNASAGNSGYIVLKISKRVFAVVIALLVCAVIACAGYATFRLRKGRSHKPRSNEYFFDPFKA